MLSDNARGALVMTGAMAAFTLSDTVMKLIGQQMPLFQAMFLRGILTGLVFTLLAWRMGALSLAGMGGRDRGFLALRVFAEAACAWAFFMALFNMPLANVIAILQALPLTITLAGVLFLGDRVGWRRWSMILLGFVGVLLIVRPGAEGFDLHAIYALISVAFVTLRDIATRQMSVKVPSITVAFYTAIGVTAFAGLGSLAEDWVQPDPRLGLLLLGAGVFIVFGYLLSIMAMRVGEISHVAPFRYTGMLWALAMGWLVFAEWPDQLTLLGAALVVVSGLVTLYREAMARRSAARLQNKLHAQPASR